LETFWYRILFHFSITKSSTFEKQKIIIAKHINFGYQEETEIAVREKQERERERFNILKRLELFFLNDNELL